MTGEHRVLMIDPTVRRHIQHLIGFAMENPVSRRQLTQTVELNAPPVGNNPRHCLVVPVGYRCVYSVEDQPHGLSRHLSVSVGRPRHLPSPEAMTVLMLEFGFSAQFSEALGKPNTTDVVVKLYEKTGAVFWLEKEAIPSINVVERITLG